MALAFLYTSSFGFSFCCLPSLPRMLSTVKQIRENCHDYCKYTGYHCLITSNPIIKAIHCYTFFYRRYDNRRCIAIGKKYYENRRYKFFTKTNKEKCAHHTNKCVSFKYTPWEFFFSKCYFVLDKTKRAFCNNNGAGYCTEKQKTRHAYNYKDYIENLHESSSRVGRYV